MTRFIVLLFVFFTATAAYANATKSYLKQVHPLLPVKSMTNQFIRSVDFYYAPFPKGLNISKKNPQFYCLSWMNICGDKAGGSIFRNLYDKHNTQKFKYRQGVPSNGYAQVMHYKWYNEPSLYFYVAKGTGIYMDVGHTLIADNKVDALKKLGLSNQDILNYAPPEAFGLIKQFAQLHHVSFKQALSQVITAIVHNKDYQLNRLAGGASYDIVLTKLCRQHHYSTFQFTIQPNTNGGWGYELMDCRSPMSMPLVKRWQQEAHYLSQRNPVNLKMGRPCHYRVPFSQRLYCTSAHTN